MKQNALLMLLLLILLGLQYRLWVGQGSWAEVANLKRQVEAQQAQNAKLMERNNQLYSEVESLRNDLESIEERARTELGLIRDGESFYLIIDDKTQ